MVQTAFSNTKERGLPRPFVLRRLHSILGLWLVIYLCEHLLVNSLAALTPIDDGSGFIGMVNRIHRLPYLRVIELLFLAIPFIAHAIWGIIYALRSKSNSYGSRDKKPVLSQYRRNRAFSWQRITSWILLVGILAHVVQMRFLHNPPVAHRGIETSYLTRLNSDPSLYAMADKLDLTIYTQKKLKEKSAQLKVLENQLEAKESIALADEVQEDKEWLHAASKRSLGPGQVIVDAPNAGTAFLLVVLQTFKSPLMVLLYSILVVASCYHAFNGLWTLMITWGVTVTRHSQARMRQLTLLLMAITTFLGLLAIWGTFLF